MIRISRFITALAVAASLLASIGCLVQVSALATKVDTMALAMTSMQRNLAAAACHDCRARVVSEVRR